MALEAGRARSSPEDWRRNSRKRELQERVVKVVLTSCAYLSVLTTFGIVFVLLFETVGFFRKVSILEFLTSTQWAPPSGQFGILPLVYGTLMATIIAVAVALPLGLLSAIYLSEYASKGLRRWLKPALEILAGVPTVVYGYFALTFITPFFRDNVFPGMGSFNALSAGLIMGVMIIPTVASVSEDAIFAVPRSLREGAYALGATRRETATKIVVPAALSGIVAAVILGISRAIGETMIVTIAMGSQANWGGSPLESMQAMTAYIVQVVGGETPRGSVTYQSIFAVGSALFVMTLTLNLVSYWFVRRFREIY
ncbi:MAG: phosphate ABC transporter permease subunit PstC [Actinomycetota bacterium]|nr:phosphate ABC transporter permease subunit PstC [Actinomycetota bacterium]MDQ3568569.1 phosphate ABC transporter permease subunit PstC [Actinomycetota bacterium]